VSIPRRIDLKRTETARPSRSDLHDFVARLLPDCVEVVEGPIGDEYSLLWPEEAARVAQAVPKRRAEFACGRLFARRAIRNFGVGDTPILAGADRVPIWPPGLIGSISHSDHYCAAAVARQTEVSALGIDIEEVRRFRPDLTPHFLSSFEIETDLEGLPHQQQLEHAAVIFSAKESLYKCLYPLTHTRIAFHDVEAPLDPVCARFHLRLAVPIGPFGADHRFAGRYVVKSNRVATAVLLSAQKLS